MTTETRGESLRGRHREPTAIFNKSKNY